MKGMVLAAGYGERLRPLTDTTPKPLLEIGKTSMIRNALGFLSHHGIKDIAINLHHLGHKIKKEFADSPRAGVNLHFIEEKVMMGTAGGIKGAEKFMGDSPFVVVNSDVLTDMDLSAIMAFHLEKRALATLVLRDNADPARYGTLAMDKEGRLVRFLETCSPFYREKDIDGGVKMFTGVSVFSPAIFPRIPAGRPVDISSEIYPSLVESGEALYSINHAGYWADIGTMESYRHARLDVASGKFKTFDF